MTKKLLIGLVPLLAVAAFAMAPSAALAGEFGHCVKVATAETGGYEDAGCTEVNAAHEGEYEWTQVAPWSNIPYTSETGEAVLHSAAGDIVCQASTDWGKVTGPFTDVDTVKFTGCVLLATGGKCNSAGQEAGTIETNRLRTFLLDHGTPGLSGLEPIEGEVWTEFVSRTGPTGYQAEFVCEPGILFRVSGSLSGVTTPVNVMATTSTTEFETGKGEQDLITEISLDGGVSWVTVPSEELTTGTTTFAEPIEIRACNEAGAVSEGKGAPDCIES